MTLTKAEVGSWFRIHEMFRFQAFHMYGIIGSSVVFGAIITYLIKRYHLKSLEKGQLITFTPKTWRVPRYLICGTIFGLGWALTSACPDPMYILIGNGFLVVIVMVLSAMLCTFVYGICGINCPISAVQYMNPTPLHNTFCASALPLTPCRQLLYRGERNRTLTFLRKCSEESPTLLMPSNGMNRKGGRSEHSISIN